MTVREIIRADKETLFGQGSSMLRTAFTPVFDFGAQLQQIIDDLRDTLRSDTLSVGLAAPQIGYRDAVAVVNISEGKPESEDLILINPIIVIESGQKELKYESCMSIPHMRGLVERRKKVTVRYFDSAGAEITLHATGFMARVLFHEIDHLNGVLFVDRLPPAQTLEETSLFKNHGIT